MDNSVPTKSCDPQLLQEMPWPQLEKGSTDPVRAGPAASNRGGGADAHAFYWRMGMALSLIRGNYAQGEWDSWLASVQINKTRLPKRGRFTTPSPQSRHLETFPSKRRTPAGGSPRLNRASIPSGQGPENAAQR